MLFLCQIQLVVAKIVFGRDEKTVNEAPVEKLGEIFTARKRSMGQGNIFSSMCQEFCTQGGVPGQVHHPGRYPPRQVHPPAGTPPNQVHP